MKQIRPSQPKQSIIVKTTPCRICDTTGLLLQGTYHEVSFDLIDNTLYIPMEDYETFMNFLMKIELGPRKTYDV